MCVIAWEGGGGVYGRILHVESTCDFENKCMCGVCILIRRCAGICVYVRVYVCIFLYVCIFVYV